ncbi:M1 family metallopeptidase [Hymenobacter endophyticus]|uniref:M1 family metallopeptidase n=1 Tax=Hymenobacter endophyticus TaxID=3076335 RepID=A0ABU3TKN6_9BACT|nr:M1 family metallopeptidase [Hymenobacter endophyticus]MDU0371938.1 M1 family metallopeptidase [Hymenobacter endophyticus]
MKKFLALSLLLAQPLLGLAQSATWQQQVNYSIDVALDDRQHVLTGREELEYTNNSPQPLAFIWFHLWPNAYRDNSTAFARQQLRNGSRKFQFATASQRGFIDGLEFHVNGQAARLEYDASNPDMAKLVLPQALAPGAKATITTPFRVKIPDSFSRFGHVGQGYQITQWYPKPAVYDQKGWHPMPYLDQGEFYSEFGSFDVRITLPANYTVGATGVLQNPEEQQRLDQLAAATASKKTQQDFGTDLKFPASAAETKTLRYVQDRVHDFAWFADKRFNVLKSGVTLPSGKQVTSWVMFTNKDAQQWIKGLQDVNDALTYYSQWVGEYPYASATAVDGALSAGSGMEYPMVTVTQPSAIVHEVGHNWFYGILGSNERDFPWMDEGVNSYVENRIAERNDPAAGQLSFLTKSPKIATKLGVEGLPAAALNQIPYQAAASRGLDQPVSGPKSGEYGKLNYGVIVYGKTASLLKYLAGYLGQEKFDAAMQAYYQRWQFRHPYPEDMQAVFEETTGQKLDWFFQNLLTTQNHYEVALSDMLVQQGTVKVLVRNDSPAPLAVPVATLDAQGKVLETRWTPVFGGTEDEEKDETQLNFRREGVAAVVIDPEYLTPQLNRRDDQRQLEGSFPTWEPLQVKPLASPERWDRHFINWVPVLGANTSDKFMLGAAFYTNLLTPKRLNFLAMPMYSFNQKEVNGIGSVSLNVLPQRNVRQLVTKVQLTRFERFTKLEPSITLQLPHSAYNGVQQWARLATTSVQNEDENLTSSIQTLEYGAKHGNALQSWSAQAELNFLTSDANSDNTARQATLLRATATYGRYYSAKKQVRARLFGGTFLKSSNDFLMGLSGSFDYRRQHTYLDRQQISDALTAQVHQTDDRDGGFKGYVPAVSRTWLTTLNLEADLPVTSLAVYGDLGVGEVFNATASTTTTRTYYGAGLILPLAKNILRLYIPVAGSQFANGLPESRRDFTSNIRFVLHLEQLSPFRLLDEQLAR